jgi:hypothetical protein
VRGVRSCSEEAFTSGQLNEEIRTTIKIGSLFRVSLLLSAQRPWIPGGRILKSQVINSQ